MLLLVDLCKQRTSEAGIPSDSKALTISFVAKAMEEAVKKAL